MITSAHATLLSTGLLLAGDYAGARKLLKQYQDDATSILAYARALLSFAKSGATAESQKLLKEAVESNKFVPDFLLGNLEAPEGPAPAYRIGHESEAVNYVIDSDGAWESIKGAISWLRDSVLSDDQQKSQEKRMLVSELLDELLYEDLLKVDKHLYARLQTLEDQRHREILAELSVGDFVTFPDTEGIEKAGIVKKINRKTVHVVGYLEETTYKVPAMLLVKLSDPETALEKFHKS